jgi:hypothetical protein
MEKPVSRSEKALLVFSVAIFAVCDILQYRLHDVDVSRRLQTGVTISATMIILVLIDIWKRRRTGRKNS